MRNELKEAIRRLHSDEYKKLLDTEKRIKKSKGNGSLRRLVRHGKGLGPSRRITLLSLVILVAFAIYTLVAGIYYFNQFSIIKVDLNQTRSLVDNELKRRANLLPNLLTISVEYRAHEKLLYEYVSEMRTHLNGLEGSEAQAPGVEGDALSKLLSSLLAIAEEYPELKATQSFEQLMADWTETENRVAEARVAYIDTIKKLNAMCTTFPSNLYAKFFGVKKGDPFSFDDPEAEPIRSMEFFSAYVDGRTAELKDTQ